MNNSPHRWSADREGKHPDDDKLGRLDFSRRVAKELRGWRNKESLVVSLNGEWGSGKTTLVNLVLHYIDEQAKIAGESPPVVVRFNPWQWSGQDMLFEAFFGEIGHALGREQPGERGAELAKKWKLLGALSGAVRVTAQWAETGATAIAAASVASENPTVTASASLTARAANWLKGLFSAGQDVSEAAAAAHALAQPPSLDEVRTDLKRLLNEMPAPLIVVIDDIDRLTKEQVRMLVQLVKANADFSNVAYVLLYQKNIVASALDEVTCEKGHQFLKKIVQVELEVPAAPDYKMREMLGGG
ncbi:MAG: P-loop NTPase fold protein [Nibricoccus sp.]